MAAIIVRAIAAASIPATIAFVLAPVGAMMLVPAAAALVLALVCRPRARGRTGVWLLGLALALVAAIAGARTRELVDATLRLDGWTTIDLASEPMPASPPRYLAVRGHLRDGFALAEYATAEGSIPDQSRPADAVLVPMTGSTDAAVPLTGAIVVARVRAGARDPAAVVTLLGRTEPLAPELLRTIVDLGAGDVSQVDGVLLDTLALPEPREAWTSIGVLALLVVGATIAYAIALSVER